MKEIEKIALGVIKPGLRAGRRRIKIMRENDKVLLLKMRCSNVLQELRVYTNDADATVTKITAFAQKKGWGVS